MPRPKAKRGPWAPAESSSKRRAGLEVARHLVDRSTDSAGECADRKHHESRYDCKDDAVLGHRLTFLVAEASAKVHNQIRQRHDRFTPSQAASGASRARVGRGLVVHRQTRWG